MGNGQLPGQSVNASQQEVNELQQKVAQWQQYLDEDDRLGWESLVQERLYVRLLLEARQNLARVLSSQSNDLVIAELEERLARLEANIGAESREGNE